MLNQAAYIKELVDREQIFVECAPSITERIMTSTMCQEFVIENYSKLKEKIYYTMTRKEEFSEHTFKLYKTNKVEKTNRRETNRIGIHRFQFHCELTEFDIRTLRGSLVTNKIEFYIMYDQGEMKSLGEPVETDYGYSIEVPNEFIVNHRNKYLRENDKLVLQFRYRHHYYTRGCFCRSGLPRKEDEERLSEDLLDLYETHKFADFAFMDGDGKEHLVHKFICKSRSAVVDKIYDNNVVALTIRGKSDHVEIAIRYMYSGILPKLSVDDILQVLEVAEELDIKSLLFSIRFALLQNLNRSNAERIHKVISNYPDMYNMLRHVEEFLFPKK